MGDDPLLIAKSDLSALLGLVVGLMPDVLLYWISSANS